MTDESASSPRAAPGGSGGRGAPSRALRVGLAAGVLAAGGFAAGWIAHDHAERILRRIGAGPALPRLLPKPAPGLRDVAGEGPLPSVSLTLLPAHDVGVLLHIRTERFRIVPERFGQAHVPGEGHLLVTINGVPSARIFSEWHHLSLLPGTHEIGVALVSHANERLAAMPLAAAGGAAPPGAAIGASDVVRIRPDGTAEPLRAPPMSPICPLFDPDRPPPVEEIRIHGLLARREGRDLWVDCQVCPRTVHVRAVGHLEEAGGVVPGAPVQAIGVPSRAGPDEILLTAREVFVAGHVCD